MNYKTIVFAGPSAVGKTLIEEILLNLYPLEFDQARLYTTRKPRRGKDESDRFFVSDDEFAKLVNQGKIVIHDVFGGCSYGYTKKSLFPNEKHLVVNVWPWLIKDLSKYDHVMIVGMQAPQNGEKMLTQRMLQRGDSEETIKIRLGLIEKDMADLEKNRHYVETSGKMFTINDDSTICDEIIPWIEKKLSLGR